MNICSIIYFVGAYLVCFSYCGKRKAQGKLTYGVNWSQGFKLCEDIDESESVIDVTPLKVDKVSAVNTMLSGHFEFKSPIMPGTEMLVSIDKETDQGKVLAFTFEMNDMCEYVPDKDKPWTAFFDAMKLEERKCPLPARTYPIEDMALSLSAASSLMTHENVGEYVATVTLLHRGDGLDVMEHTLTCYTFSFSIDEIREQAE